MTMIPVKMPVAPAESEIARATRLSIKKHLPLGSIMSQGNNNPLTLHAEDDAVFACIWELVGEAMVVTGELRRPTKEAVAKMFSQRNNCPVCVTSHTIMEYAAVQAELADTKKTRKDAKVVEKERLVHDQALDYVGLVLDALNNQEDIDDLDSYSYSESSKSKKRFSALTEKTKAECALVVLLFTHLNRVVSVALGEELSTAMYSVPRAAAKVLESQCMVRIMNRFMAPLMATSFRTKNKPGFTALLFPEEDFSNTASRLPKQLQGVLRAGPERAIAVARLQHWVEHYEETAIVEGGIIPKTLLYWLDDPETEPVCTICSPQQVLECWKAKHFEGVLCSK